MHVSIGKENIMPMILSFYATLNVDSYLKVKEREKTSLLLFPLDEVNNNWTNARSDFSDVSSQAACRYQHMKLRHQV
jgi:hypothetical protein